MHSLTTAPVPVMDATQTKSTTHSLWRTSILFTVIATVLFGLGYPLLVTGLAGVLFPHKAAGSLITERWPGDRV